MIEFAAHERLCVLIALRYLRGRFGSWAALARALRSKRVTLRRLRAGGRLRARTARHVAQLVGVSVADLLAGKFTPPGACPTCGAAAQ